MKNLFVFLVIVLLLFACKKQHTFHIKAINAVTGEAYAGLEFGVSATKTGINGEKLVYDHNGTLDANGEAYVTLKVKTGRTYNIGCTKPPNTCYVKNIQFTYGQEDADNPTFQFEYAECANIKLDINNVNCQNPTDKMNFRWRNNYTNFGGWSTDRFGCYSYLSEYFQIPAGWIIYEWKVDRSGIVTSFMDSILIGAGGQGTFVMNY